MSVIAATILISIGNVAAVGTVLALILSAHLNFFTATGAMCRIWHIGFRLLVPPPDTAGIGAEPPAAAFAFINLLTALHT